MAKPKEHKSLKSGDSIQNFLKAPTRQLAATDGHKKFKHELKWSSFTAYDVWFYENKH